MYLAASSQRKPACPKCGNARLNRLFSTFSIRSKTYKDAYEDILSDDRLTRGMLANDPRALAEWNKRMSPEEEVAPEYEDVLGQMERGEMPAELSGASAGGTFEEADQD